MKAVEKMFSTDFKRGVSTILISLSIEESKKM